MKETILVKGGAFNSYQKVPCLAYPFISWPFLLFQEGCVVDWKNFKGAFFKEGGLLKISLNELAQSL